MKSVVQALPSYAMSCFLLPKSFCKKLDSIIMKFWWGGTQDKKPFYWKKWGWVSKGKGAGGLGFRNFHLFNKALVAKQCWKLLSEPDFFWATFIKSVYYPNCSFLEAKLGSRPSWFWSSVIKSRELLVKGARFNVGNGESIRIWHDPWLPRPKNFKVDSPRSFNIGEATVQCLISPVSKTWLEPQAMFSPEEASIICAIPIAFGPVPDKWVWHYSNNGKFSVKLAYHLAKSIEDSQSPLEATSTFNPPKKFWQSIWGMNAPPKIKNFWWKVCNNSLASRENLWRRNCAPDPVCPRCNSEIESIEHVLFRCAFACKVWSGLEDTVSPPGCILSTLQFGRIRFLLVLLKIWKFMLNLLGSCGRPEMPFFLKVDIDLLVWFRSVAGKS